MNIFKKMPGVKEIAPVYAVGVAILYSWAILRFFWVLPSLTLFSPAGDMVPIFFYVVLVSFLESILILLPPLALSLVLPQRWFYDHFASRGVSLIISTLLFFMYLSNRFHVDSTIPLELIRLRNLPIVLAAILASAFLMDQIGFLRKIIMELADRLIVFLYISIPVSVVAFLFVLVRNIF